MSNVLRSLAVHLPDRYIQELRRLRFGWQIRHDRFRSPEPEHDHADTWLAKGDTAIDVGANVGHYTLRFASLVGPEGRVYAFEPISSTFALLAANVQRAGFQNVTLMNAAVSDATRLARMDVPQWANGVGKNPYRAHLSDKATGSQVLCLPVDSLSIPGRVALVKIDAEGFDLQVLNGMRQLIQRDRPLMIVEMPAATVPAFIRDGGYEIKSLPGSPNVVLVPLPRT